MLLILMGYHFSHLNNLHILKRLVCSSVGVFNAESIRDLQHVLRVCVMLQSEAQLEAKWGVRKDNKAHYSKSSLTEQTSFAKA